MGLIKYFKNKYKNRYYRSSKDKFWDDWAHHLVNWYHQRFVIPRIQVLRLKKPTLLIGTPCPKAKYQPQGWMDKALYREEPNGDYTCSYCGSLHPEQMMEIIDHIIRHKTKDGVSISCGKPGKYYIKRPSITNASEGAIKFYADHLHSVEGFCKSPTELKEHIVKRFNLALSISKRAFAEKFNQTHKL